ncbi:MAG TPA: SRPBCC family protein [Streptosporangiaceae bacterium]|nr:SRPBCC family protein [Streptosporangiaceae bacterium]
MQLTSAIRISRPAPEVLDALLDAGTVAACLPGSRLIGEVADNTYAGELRLRIGPMHTVYAGTVRLDNADRDAGTATLHASGWEQGGQGRADASVTLRVESRGGSTRVLISADLMIRGKVAEYAPGAIGDVGQRLVEQFAGNVEQLLATQAGAQAGTAQAGTAQAGIAQAGPRQAGPPEAGIAAVGAIQAGSGTPPAVRPRWTPSRPDKRAVAAAALLLAGGALAAGALALAVWRRRHPEVSQLPDTPWFISHEGARHG